MTVESSADDTTVWGALRAFLPFGRPYRKQLAAAVALLVLSVGCQTVNIMIFGRITDTVLVTGGIAAFWRYAAALGTLAVFGAAVSFAGGYLTTWVGEHVVLRLRDHTFAHVQRLPAAAVARYRHGDVLARLTSDIDAVEKLAASGVVRAVTGCVSALFFASAAFLVRWDLALAVCAMAPVFWLVSRRLSARIAPATRQERAGNAALTATLAESLSTLTLARLYNRHADQATEVHDAGRTWLRAGLRQARVALTYPCVWEIVETVCVLAVLGLGAWEISATRLTVGGLLSFAAYLGYLYPSLQGLGELSVDASAASAAGERLRTLWDTTTVDSPSTIDAPMPTRPPELRLVRVSFRYPDAPGPSLRDVSLSIRPGTFVAITGASGTGKSTLATLLVGLLAPDTGQILIGGQDAATLPVRELITLLPQRVTLLHRSVAANIAYGRPDATRQQIIAAAKTACAHEFITTFPHGYDTVIGQHGHNLSGGQARRLALARALLRDSPILILDEPTTGLDATTAARVMDNLRQDRTRTTILITHNPNLTTHTDHTLLLTDGHLDTVDMVVDAQGDLSGTPTGRMMCS